jgi:hypothetical protein
MAKKGNARLCPGPGRRTLDRSRAGQTSTVSDPLNQSALCRLATLIPVSFVGIRTPTYRPRLICCALSQVRTHERSAQSVGHTELPANAASHGRRFLCVAVGRNAGRWHLSIEPILLGR